MIDIKLIRENPQYVIEGCKKKQIEVDINNIVLLDKERRELLSKIEEFRTIKNEANKKMQSADKAGKEKIIEEMRDFNKENEGLEKKYKEIEEKFISELKKVPNIPFDEVPVGKSDKENKVLRKEGKIRNFDFEVKDYIEITKKMDIIDTERAAKTSGARFGIMKGDAALLQIALVNFAFDITKKYNFIPVIPPVMLKTEMMAGMGYVERGEDEIYRLEKDDLYLIGTSEQIIGSMHSNEVFDEKELPKRYVGYSSCFRREAGSYGKDTRGILRVHQFEKVEMFSFTTPEKSKEEHEILLKIEEEIMQLLEIPYQVIDICSGDLGDPAAKKYDIEAWMPGQNEYRETHSTSNCTDYQARRLNIRYKNEDGTSYLHMLNGTAIAIGRIMIALIENHQQKDGSIKIPEALIKYTHFEKISPTL
jgi:seryl-tRNA synthetase